MRPRAASPDAACGLIRATVLVARVSEAHPGFACELQECGPGQRPRMRPCGLIRATVLVARVSEAHPGPGYESQKCGREGHPRIRPAALSGLRSARAVGGVAQ